MERKKDTSTKRKMINMNKRKKKQRSAVKIDN